MSQLQPPLSLPAAPVCPTSLFPITNPASSPSFPAAHVIRIHAIFDKDRTILAVLGALWAVQFVVTAVCCAFYFCMSNDHVDPAKLQRRLTFDLQPFSRSVEAWPGVHCWAQTCLGGNLLGCSDFALHRFREFGPTPRPHRRRPQRSPVIVSSVSPSSVPSSLSRSSH